MRTAVLALVLVILEVFSFPLTAQAGSHGDFRPVCAVGDVGPGCFAPVRKSARFTGRVAVGAGRVAVRGTVRVARFAGRAAVRAGRAVGRAARGAGRLARGAVRGTGRVLFGRRFHA